MPQIDPSAPTLSRKYCGVSVSVPAAFTEGHVATAKEAAWFSGILATAVGNAFAARERTGKLVDAKGKPLSDEAKAQVFYDMFEAYEPGGTTRAPKASSDPVTSLVHTLAQAAVKALIVRNGLKVKDYMSAKVTYNDKEMSKFSEQVARYTERFGDELRAQAEAQLASLPSADADFNLDAPQPEAEAA